MEFAIAKKHTLRRREKPGLVHLYSEGNHAKNSNRIYSQVKRAPVILQYSAVSKLPSNNYIRSTAKHLERQIPSVFHVYLTLILKLIEVGLIQLSLIVTINNQLLAFVTVQ